MKLDGITKGRSLVKVNLPLLDSVQRPFVFPVSDTSPATPEAYLRFLLANHNEQVDEEHQFKLGNVTVKDDNDYIARSDTEYSTTWDLINQGLISTHGGYLWVRHEADGNYLDYLADFSTLSNQPIEFGRNLLDLKKERKGEDIVTGIVPIGATLTEDVTDETTGKQNRFQRSSQYRILTMKLRIISVNPAIAFFKGGAEYIRKDFQDDKMGECH